MKAVVLAAGRGERLEPFTLTRPKHMIPVGGKPMLEWLLMGLGAAGMEEILIVTLYKEDQIREYFGSGSALGLRISYASQQRAIGTANAIAEAEEYVGDESFLALYGDLLLSDEAIKKMVSASPEEPRMCVVPVENPSLYGVAQIERGIVKRIAEKPRKGEEPSNLANAGVYVLQPDIFSYIQETEVSPRGELEFTDTLERFIKDGGTLRAELVSSEEWLDIGHLWNLLDANERVLQEVRGRIEGDVEEGVRILGPVVVERETRIRSGAYIEGPVIIKKGSDIGPNCYIRPSTTIGENVRIGNACEIKNSIIMNDTHVAHLSYVGDSVIGSRCNLGAGTITANIRFDKENVFIEERSKRTDTGKRKLGTFMGDNVQTGTNVSLMPGTRVGPGSWIAPGLTVYEDIKADTFLRPGSAELKLKPNKD